jgi:hypothetical protein
MLKRALLALLVSGCFGGYAWAQSYCITHPTKLACELPVATHAPGTNLTFFNPLFGTQLSQLPFPSASSGFVLSFDKALGIPTFTAGSLGPVLSGRAETVGHHKLFLAFSYQQFNFDTLDGLDLKHLSLEETFPFLILRTRPFTRRRSRASTRRSISMSLPQPTASPITSTCPSLSRSNESL